MNATRLLVLLLVACGGGNPPAGAVAGAPPPVVTPPPIDVPAAGATVRMVQRTSAPVPGAREALELQLGDITAGRALLTLTRTGDPAPLASATLAEGEALKLALEGHGYAITIESMNNVLVGDDWAMLRLTAESRPVPVAAPVFDERARINALLEVVRTSGIVFIRNGTDHSAADAAKHLNDKWERAGDRIGTAEEFIEQLASRSSQSGEAYRVRLPDGSEREAGPWLREQLAAQ